MRSFRNSLSNEASPQQYILGRRVWTTKHLQSFVSTADGQPAHFEQLPQRLYERELEVLRQAAHVVMALYGVAVLLFAPRRRTGLYDVRVQGTLHACRVPSSQPPQLAYIATSSSRVAKRQQTWHATAYSSGSAD